MTLALSPVLKQAWACKKQESWLRSPTVNWSPQPGRGIVITVGLNTDSAIYHCPGSHWYGNTKEGKYLSQGAAIAAGYRAAYDSPCECAK